MYNMALKPKVCDFDAMWPKLKNTTTKVIQMCSINNDEWNERIHDVYNLCISVPEPHSERLYIETKKLIENHIKGLHNKIINDTSDVCLLRKYYNEWNTFQKGLDYLNSLYAYLNGQYIKKLKHTNLDIDFVDIDPNEQLMEINELGAYLWKMNMILPLKDQLVSLLLSAIDRFRDGSEDVPDTQIIQNVIQSFISVERYRPSKDKNQLYQEIFESSFLKATNKYYQNQAKKLLENNDCSKYMEQVLERLRIERERLDTFLPEDSHTRVITECEQCMVGGYLGFLQAECRTMVEKEAKKDLHNMFLLLKPVESGLQALIRQIEERIKEKGLDEIKRLNPKDESFQADFVERILKVHSDFLALILTVFDGDKLFMAALDKACTEVVNYRENTNIPCKSPEILAKYFDNLLRKNAKCVVESEIDDKLSRAINVFKYITDKDVFQKFYSKNLAKRLIYAQYLSLDCEETMINRLKQACGYEFTTKLHRMFTDIKISEDLNRAFGNKIHTEKIVLPFQFQLLILQACAWPITQPTTPNTAIVPPVLEQLLEVFEDFYSQKFTGRKLTWLHHLCMADIKLLYTKKNYTVSMTTFHTSIFLQFQERDELTFEELQALTKLSDEALNRHLQSFVDSRLFLCDGKCADVLEIGDGKQNKNATVPNYPKETKFTLNLNFSNKRMKFKLSVAPQKETPQVQKKESDETYAWIEEDRKLFVQAAIVRIMKSRKRLNQNTLIQEVIDITKLRFTPSVVMIKKAIEALIDKQYIERVPSTSDEYQYIA